MKVDWWSEKVQTSISVNILLYCTSYLEHLNTIYFIVIESCMRCWFSSIKFFSYFSFELSIYFTPELIFTHWFQQHWYEHNLDFFASLFYFPSQLWELRIWLKTSKVLSIHVCSILHTLSVNKTKRDIKMQHTVNHIYKLQSKRIVNNHLFGLVLSVVIRKHEWRINKQTNKKKWETFKLNYVCDFCLRVIFFFINFWFLFFQIVATS